MSIWIDDTNGNIGIVDVTTGDVTLIGNVGVNLTDIAMSPEGVLYGINPNGLYTINQSTGVATQVASLNIPGASAMVFGSDGTLYVAGGISGFGTFSTVDPGTGATALLSLGPLTYEVSGDMAFVNSTLYGTINTTLYDRELISIDPATGAETLIGGSTPMSFGMNGLAPDNGTLIGASGSGLYTIDTTYGIIIPTANFFGQGLGIANGAALVIPTPTPEPPTVLLLGAGLLGLLVLSYFRREQHA